jgi:uncharacterized protein YkwD
MTLAKTKPRRPTSVQRKISGQHHKRGNSYLQPYWPYLPMIAIVSLGLLLNSWLGSMNKNVLGYATDMSISSLLTGTNNQRTANGLGALALNATLSQAAQAKAQDMMANDYWSHVSPSGVTPWYWITSDGYSYQTAGENLAYGFATSSDTITGWMNSSSHRSNILNTTFSDVGFGVINAPNYQGSGPETIVVAMYAQPYVVVPPVTSTSSGTSSGGSITTITAPTAADTDTATPENTTSSKDGGKTTQAKAVESKQISRVQLLGATNVAWSQFAVSMLASIAMLAFLLRHSFAWHKVLVRGERFVLHHPLLDIAFVTIATLGYILAQSTGTIH